MVIAEQVEAKQERGTGTGREGTRRRTSRSFGEQGRVVLLVDDDADIRDVLGALLTDEGYHVTTASDGAMALERLRGGVRPDLILLDLMMPRMTGWEFRAVQARDPALQSIPVVVFSADRGVSARVAQLGVAGFLAKPVKLDELLSVVARSSSERAHPG